MRASRRVLTRVVLMFDLFSMMRARGVRMSCPLCVFTTASRDARFGALGTTPYLLRRHDERDVAPILRELVKVILKINDIHVGVAARPR